MQILKKVFIMTLCASLFLPSSIATAHHGRSGYHGGHHDYKNRNEYGKYYSHHGTKPHLHPHGICPYSSSTTKSKVPVSKKTKCYSVKTIKRVQNKLNKLGYPCGSPDGCCDNQTQKAIRRYQRKKGLTVNGKINKTLLKKLKIKS